MAQPGSSAASSSTHAVINAAKQLQIKNPGNKSISVYKEADTSSKVIGVVVPGQQYASDKVKNKMYYINDLKGWVQKTYCKVLSSDAVVTNRSKKYIEEKLEKNKQEEKERLKVLKQEEEEKEKSKIQKKTTEYINNEFGNTIDADTFANQLLVNNLSGIYGIPYQFIPEVDTPLNGMAFGQIYADRIISRMPLLIISPGTMDFMTGYSEGEQQALVDVLTGVTGSDSLSEFVTHPGKYYTFRYDSASYWNYVNSMNRSCAAYLGILNMSINLNGYQDNLKSYDWRLACNSKLDNFITSDSDYVAFYCDAESSKNESFSNSTTPSELVSKINDYSALAKEVQFILGSHTGSTPGWLKPDAIADINNAIAGVAGSLLNSSEVFQNLAKEFSTVATGGKIAFPEIWSDSEFTQDFDVKIKLRCPCPNKLQWYLDICVPLNMLLALTLPRTPIGTIMGMDFSGQEASYNGYMAPFLVRAFYKGLFNCDMGIVTSLSISKGKEGSWTLDGLPTEVDVDMTIKDLYNVLFMTSSIDQPTQFMNNTTFLNYMAQSCGININKPDIKRSIDLMAISYGGAAYEKYTGKNFWQKTQQGIRNNVYNVFKGFFPG